MKLTDDAVDDELTRQFIATRKRNIYIYMNKGNKIEKRENEKEKIGKKIFSLLLFEWMRGFGRKKKEQISE